VRGYQKEVRTCTVTIHLGGEQGAKEKNKEAYDSWGKGGDLGPWG